MNKYILNYNFFFNRVYWILLSTYIAVWSEQNLKVKWQDQKTKKKKGKKQSCIWNSKVSTKPHLMRKQVQLSDQSKSQKEKKRKKRVATYYIIKYWSKYAENSMGGQVPHSYYWWSLFLVSLLNGISTMKGYQMPKSTS